MGILLHSNGISVICLGCGLYVLWCAFTTVGLHAAVGATPTGSDWVKLVAAVITAHGYESDSTRSVDNRPLSS